MERCTTEEIKAKHNDFSPKCLKNKGKCEIICVSRVSNKCEQKCVNETEEPLRFHSLSWKLQNYDNIFDLAQGFNYSLANYGLPMYIQGYPPPGLESKKLFLNCGKLQK